MIDIPVADIIAKIKEQKGLSEAEIRARIKEKLKQLAGLISEEGAAHIVANELGIELVKMGGEAKIRDLYPGMRGVTVPGRVTRKFDVRQFSKEGRQGKVASFFIADETGQVRVTLWNDQANEYDRFSEGEIVRVKNGFVKENRGFAELHLNADSRLEVRPNGVTLPETQTQAGRPPRERKTIKELTGDEENVELLATVVQVYDPRYFDVCPQCNKRVTVTAEADQAVVRCPEHGVVTPKTNYVLSAFLDDGTGNIRATFWRQQAQRLTEKDDAQLLQYKEHPQAFEEVKNELLGEIVRVVGRCKRNETFDRIEVTANLVFRHLDPEEELARLKRESASTVAALDAPPDVKEKMAKLVEPKPATGPTHKPSKTETEEESYEETDSDGLSGSADEEVISLDDLEDLDERLKDG
jgi:DNA/RNA endonuclease YhcR with UshA esterase domain